MGYTRWECWWWMVLRLGLPSLLLVLPVVYLQQATLSQALGYVLFSAIAGLLYPHRQRLFELLGLRQRTLQLPSLFHRQGSTPTTVDWDSARLMELIVGAAVLGGLALLSERSYHIWDMLLAL